ncbi:TlpA family protein disulfide reductase [Flavobacterium terrigena]|uniref:Thioredoxin-like n=1 Tax=Flavobacterium terrigena TaxID=402734 RepID=A0A1H6UAB0_9FLAO|nr:TlpA disulfide reductase family protein [Flavobacterium terrigena]SEI89323.1 Thioredoxin-like [Flavobacterium terrigena]
MKKVVTALAIVSVLVVAFSFTSCNSETEFSKESLETRLTTIDNKDISFEEILKENHGKAIVIDVWASWCSDCIKSMPEVKELKAKFPEVAFVNLSCDKTYDAWRVGIEKHEVTGENYLIKDGMKGAFGKSIKLDWIPRFIVVDKDGKIVLFRAIEKDFDKIRETLEKAK